MRLRAGLAMMMLAAVTGSGCASLVTPVLRHETGESLGGSGHFRVRAIFESARMFPLTPPGSEASMTEQKAGVYSGMLFGFQGAAGITSRLDVQAGTAVLLGGGGWSIGAKYQIIKLGRWALAAMMGYGRYSSKGTQTYETSGHSIDVTQTLSAYNIPISAPISYRLTKETALYSGLNYYRSGVTGAANDSFVEAVTHDFGVNLGVKLSFGKFEGDFELALVRMYDFFTDSVKYQPFWGLSAGVAF